jgi:hypothetical protein
MCQIDCTTNGSAADDAGMLRSTAFGCDWPRYLKTMGFRNLLSQELHRDGGCSGAATVYKDICGLAGLGITRVRQWNVQQLQSQAGGTDAGRQRRSSLRGPIVRYLGPDPPTRDGVLGEGSLVGRARTHLVLRSINTVADLDVRDFRSHSDHCSAVVGAQESPWRCEFTSHLRVTRVERDGVNADVYLVCRQRGTRRVIPDCHLIVIVYCHGSLLWGWDEFDPCRLAAHYVHRPRAGGDWKRCCRIRSFGQTLTA